MLISSLLYFKLEMVICYLIATDKFIPTHYLRFLVLIQEAAEMSIMTRTSTFVFSHK